MKCFLSNLKALLFYVELNFIVTNKWLTNDAKLLILGSVKLISLDITISCEVLILLIN